MFLSNKNFNENEPIYIQIENYIKGIIDKNLLAQNSKLPATREMAKLLGVSRNSVITAYENLEAEGILYTIKGKGTFISNRNTDISVKWNVSWNNYINEYGTKASELDIVKSEIPWSKDLISFKSISPEGELFNIEEVKKAFLNTISKENHKILNYGYAKGYKPLMEYILEYTKMKMEVIMKRKLVGLISMLLVIVLATIALIRIKEEEGNGLKKVVVAVVTHSVFYAPQYVADGLGYFEDEGLDVELVLTSGADNVMAAVLSGDAQIGFSGSEATIYVYNGGEKDYVMTFAGLTQKDGSFLVSRNKIDNFTLDDLEKVIEGVEDATIK